MSEKTYYEQRLPDLINRLKNQVDKNMEIICREVESDLGEDKFFNVLKGRKMAVEYCISTLLQIDTLESKGKEDSYYKEILPTLVEKLKQMVNLNLEVIDIEIDEEDFDDDLKSMISDDIKQMFGKDVANKIFKKLGSSDKLSEDKFHNVLKARKTAGEDTEWALNKIDELENIVNGVEVTKKIKKSWAKRGVNNK